MTGNRHNPEGNSSDSGEPDPGPYWRRMHRDWRFWTGALLMAAALAAFIFIGGVAAVPWVRPQESRKAVREIAQEPKLPCTGADC